MSDIENVIENLKSLQNERKGFTDKIDEFKLNFTVSEEELKDAFEQGMIQLKEDRDRKLADVREEYANNIANLKLNAENHKEQNKKQFDEDTADLFESVERIDDDYSEITDKVIKQGLYTPLFLEVNGVPVLKRKRGKKA